MPARRSVGTLFAFPRLDGAAAFAGPRSGASCSAHGHISRLLLRDRSWRSVNGSGTSMDIFEPTSADTLA